MVIDDIMVSVIIPNYNGEQYLPACLESFAEQSFRHLEVVVVDNASNDRSREVVRTRFPQVTLLCLEANLGFAAAANAGIKAARGDFVVLMNNDTVAEPAFVAELYSALSKEGGAAMAAPLMSFLKDRRIVNSAGLGYSIAGTNHDIGFGKPLGPEFERPMWILGPSGGAGMYRREIFERIGGFDEDFFMYFEDVDFSVRAQLAGYRCIYVPSAKIYHAEGGSSGSLPRSKNFFFARNSLWTVIKNYPASFLLRYSPALLCEMLKRALSPLRKGDASAIAGYCSALFSLGR